MPVHNKEKHISMHKILYIEDDATNRVLMAQIFENEADIGLVMANTASEAMSITEHLPFDLIVTDIKLPDMDGYQVLYNVRHSKRTKETPIIALTAAAMNGDVERGLDAGFDAYITKPYNIVSLVEKVREFCHQHS
jgi:CheY-like chemotaxis protein